MFRPVRRLALGLALGCTLLTGYVATSIRQAPITDAASRVVTFVTDIGGLNDNGFNHLGYLGTQTGASATGYTPKFIETTSSSDYAKNLTTAAQQSHIVVAVGFSFAQALQTVSAKYPKVHFAIIDFNYAPSLKLNNVLGNIFKPEQSSYLAGILAAGISKTHTVGFIGGVNVPLIKAFGVGFAAGAKSYDPSVKVLTTYTNSFTDQSAGRVAALSEINQGADVVYPAAGGSGLGSLSAANQKHVYAIGVDADQNFLYPHTIVTSVVKHVEVAVANAIRLDAAGAFKSGTLYYDLKNNGVGLAPYHSLASIVPAKVQTAIAKARKGIVAGDITVPVQ